jgi:cytochrome c oxidase cbb3-type subunit 3
MKTNSKYTKSIIALFASLLSVKGAMAQDAAVTAPAVSEKMSVWSSGAGIIMVMTIVILLAVIFILGKIVRTLVEEDTYDTAKKMKANKGLLSLIVLTLISFSAQAQDAVAAAAPKGVSLTFGLETTVFWTLAGVLVFEFIILMILCYVLYTFLVRKGLIKAFDMSANLPAWMQWNKMTGNDLPFEKEKDYLIDHDYDGIQELDNGMPPMLKYIFVITIIFAVYYLVDYHVLKASPLQLAEYEIQLEKGAADKLEYLKKAGASVDENTVTLLADASMIDGGQKIYATNCVACHGDKGQGGVGPNLTDKFWIHGGGIKDIFKTVKYGVPDKGMRAWQSEIKPADMQAVASYILAKLGNTNVAGGKAPQGVEYVAAAAVDTAPADSASAAPATPTVDSAKAK